MDRSTHPSHRRASLALVGVLTLLGCSSPAAEQPARPRAGQPSDDKPKTIDDCEAVCACAWASPRLLLRDAGTHGPLVGFSEARTVGLTITGVDRKTLTVEVECWANPDGVQCPVPDLEPGNIEIALKVPGYADESLTTAAKYKAPGDPCCPCDMAYWLEPATVELEPVTAAPG